MYVIGKKVPGFINDTTPPNLTDDERTVWNSPDIFGDMSTLNEYLRTISTLRTDLFRVTKERDSAISAAELLADEIRAACALSGFDTTSAHTAMREVTAIVTVMMAEIRRLAGIIDDLEMPDDSWKPVCRDVLAIGASKGYDREYGR